MCIVQGKIEKVSGTCIFVAPVDSIKTSDSKKRLRQLTIYSNKVVQKSAPRHSEVRGRWTPSRTAPVDLGSSSASDGPTPAMILPAVSFLNGTDVTPVDLTNHKDVFEVLDTAFPKVTSNSYSALSSGFTRSRGFDTIAVTQVGSYDVSIVPTRDDFARLSQEHFVLDSNVAKLFAERYPTDYAFVVCRLRPGEKFHPIAYVSALSSDVSLFVPAYHYHGHLETKPDWDHTIYAAGGSKAALRTDNLEKLNDYLDNASPERRETALRKLQAKLPVLLDFEAMQCLTKTKIKELRANCDLLFV